ncbi:30S ribosomal protein S5 alanine N-acetyltransferase [Alsobacter soli]|uniref:30S ribosomal protein S5 alanine N-acetyltransferase n=1 Tax=Alsobacter soli TaxID=2109933 RepID=A0A2T1HSL6_9HYPH|nr:GNAT family protein [Alsobacter soli]PSC04650.1 30S ribosomal protein S5 alanine N-acetyltransferase [Alsobacter soli]
MAFFRLPIAAEEPPSVRGQGLLLRTPRLEDFDAWSALREASREFLKPWEPIWPADDLTRSAYRRRLKRYAREIEEDAAYPFFLFRERDGALLGGLTLGMVRRGVSQAATLGYWMGQAFAGRGYMTAGVRLAAHYAFDTLRLRRIEAACVPYNLPSMKLLERVGFQREGYARQYLCIDGLWQDHLLYALLRSDFAPDTPSP